MMQAFGRLALGLALAAGAAWAAPALAQDKTILFSISKASEPFFEVMRGHAEDEAGKLSIRLIFEDGKGDSTDQAADIENALTRERIDAALIAPNDIYALAPAVNFALAQGIPVVTVDRHVYNTARDVPHVGIDNVAGGRLLAQWVVDNFPKGANVLHLTGQPGSSTGIDRAKGVRDGLAEAKGNYQIIAEMSGNWSRAEAQMLVEGQLTVMTSPPDAIVADNDDMAMGALEAIRLTGRDPAAIKVVGFDALPFALEKVREGTLAATVDQKPGAQIRTALRMVADHLRNHTPLHSATIDAVLITQDNIAVTENASQTN
jgi:inositol transport system substrate-binding protein